MTQPRRRLARLAATALVLLFATPSLAQGFSFSGHEEAERKADAEKGRKIMAQLAEPCKKSIAGQKIAVLIAEKRGGDLAFGGGSHGLLAEALNSKLSQVGLNPVSQATINAQIAQAQIKAVLNNDPDAAVAASSKLGARFFLNGIVSSRENRAMQVNVGKGAATMNVNSVDVSIVLTLTAGGKVISRVTAKDSSWAGADTIGAAQQIVENQASGLIAQLYSDFCAKGGK